MRVNRPPGPPLAISIALLVAGFIAAVVGFIGAAASVADSLGTEDAVPAVVHRHFTPDTYDIYQAMPTTLIPADVSVTGPGGVDLPVHTAEPTTVNLIGEKYLAVVEFSVTSGGDYTVVIRSPTRFGGGVLISHAGGQDLHVRAAWLVLLAAGGFVALVGLVLLIIGVVRRDHAGRAQRLAAAPTGPILVPAGWYPDPGGTARYRWWDGAKWTDHTG